MRSQIDNAVSAAERYITGESQEVITGIAMRWAQRFVTALPALSSRNYQLYFGGQLVSLVGTWLQIVAQGWLVLNITHSAFWVGTVSALGLLPVLIFSLFGGVIVDRFYKRNILFFTQTSSMLLAFILGLLTIFGKITVFEISILAFLLGTVNALDAPARQAFVVEMVGKDKLSSAVALNAGVYNGARVIGPSIAGLLIALIGTGGAFLVNGISYIAVIVALFYIHVSTRLPSEHPKPLKAIKEGLSYSFSHPIIRSLLFFVAVMAIFGWSYSTILPVIVQNVFHRGAGTLGYFYAATGLGALLAAIIFSAFSQKFTTNLFIFGGSAIFLAGLFLFTLTRTVPLALLTLFLAGFGIILLSSTMNATIQHLTRDEYRGRVMSIYTLMFMGLFPIGSFQIGIVADLIGSMLAIQIGLIFVFLYAVYFFMERNKVIERYRVYSEDEAGVF